MSSHTWNHFSPFAEGTWRVMGFLTLGLEGKASVTIHASKNGLTLKISGKIVARGKDARALSDDFDRYLEAQRAVVSAMKAQLARIEKKAEGAKTK